MEGVAMKRRFRSKSTSANQHIRLFVIITSIVIATCFVLAGLMENFRTSNVAYQNHNGTSKAQYMNPDWIHTIFGNVLPFYQPHENGMFPVSVKQPLHTSMLMTSRIITSVTDIDPMNLWSLLSTQIPVLHSNGFLLHTNDPSDTARYTNPPNDKNDSNPTPDQSGQDAKAPASATDPRNQPAPVGSGIPGSDHNNPVIYIYHTHNRESFLPNLPKGLLDDQAYDANINITEVGKRLMETLNTRGITTIQTTNDYWQYGDYPYSRVTVQKELAKYSDLQMIFDIHRDSGPRNKTTTIINGQSVGRVFFIIGGSNPNYKQNLDFANRLNKKMEQLYPQNGSNPGLSEGIWVKQKDPKYDYDTTYNQDLNPNMVLIEIGGPYNSLEECERTADLLANVIQAVWQDEQKSH
jgi:stage II sporulation protein P